MRIFLARRFRRRPCAPWLAVLLAAAGFFFSGVDFVRAHGEPAKLEEWGGFRGRIPRCQRRIGGAARLCAFEVWEARRACREAVIRGGKCDQVATEDAVRSAQTNARLAVSPEFCTSLEVQNLRFLDVFETLTDVTLVCRDIDRRLTELVFDAEGGGAPAETTAACRLAGSAAASSVFRFALRLRTAALDRIATTPLALVRKEALLSWSATRIGWARDSLRENVATRCPAADFQAVYGRTIETFLTEVTNRADCAVAGTYAQAAVACPTD